MHPIIPALQRHFDRIVVIGLHRIPDFYSRLGLTWLSSAESPIHVFPAIDAKYCKPPPWWGNEIPALWACGESHRQVIARALSDNVRNLLIMEDDCAFTDEAADVLPKFMADLPADFDGLMLGGQVSVFDGKTKPITPRVSKCVQVERLHCYGLSRGGMQKFHDILSETTSIANDYRFGDAQADGRLIVYRCEPFIAYQTDGRSAISERVEPNRAWDDRVDVRLRKPCDVRVISLVCPFAVMERLRQEGIITNGGESPPQFATLEPGRVERGEVEIAEMMLRSDPAVVARAINQLRNDAAFHRSAPLAVWHPTTPIRFNGAPVIAGGSYEEVAAKIQS